MKELFGKLGDDLKAVFKSIADSFLGIKDDQYYSAQFGNNRDYMSVDGKGLSCGGKYYHNALEQAFFHQMVFGGTGTGKTVSCAIPSLLNDLQASFIVNDNAGQIQSLVGPYLQARGTKVMSLNFGATPFTNTTLFFNPLSRIHSPSDIAKICKALMRSSKMKSDFWSIKAEELLNLAVARILHEEECHRNLANVLYLLESMSAYPKAIDVFMSDASEEITRKWKAFQSANESVRSGILSTATGVLSFIGNSEELKKMTSRDSISFAQMRREKTAIFLRVPLVDQPLYTPIIEIFFDSFFGEIFRSELPKEGKDLPIISIIDEIGTLYISNFSDIISNGRKHFLGIAGYLQSEMQFSEKYGKDSAQVILNNCSKIYFGGLHHESAKISKILGNRIVVDESGKEKHIPLMSEQEIRLMRDQVIILPHQGDPLIAPTKAYFTDSKLMKKITTPLKQEEQAEEIEVRIDYFPLPQVKEPDTKEADVLPDIPHKDSLEIQRLLNQNQP